jgi:glycerol kinase
MENDAGQKISTLRVDGGASASDLLMQMQADTVGLPIERPHHIETTALGAAMMAGLGAGVWASIDELSAIRQTDRIFVPATTIEQRESRQKTWHRAVERAKGWA